MVIRCPKCDALAQTPTDIEPTIMLAERGELRPFCVRCDYSWELSREEQHTILSNLRRYRSH